MNDDNELVFLSLAMRMGVLNREELFKAGISDADYFNLTDEAILKLEILDNKKRS